MKVVEISKIDDSVVLYFDTKQSRINAYSLASILVSIADAAKAANATLNPGHEIEIVVEALSEGSFKARISASYKSVKNIFSSQIVAGVIIGVISSYIYERTLSVDDEIKVEIHTDEVIIEKGEERLVVPRQVYDSARQVERDPKFVQAIDRTFEAIQRDPEIQGFGIIEDERMERPQFILPREAIMLATNEVVELDGKREIFEIVELQILRAILERGRKKWQFMWRGVKISAPITSKSFYDDFFSHSITIAPGDSLEVKLVIKQERDYDNGVYVNKSYEIVEVYKHNPRLRQASLG
ncbi:hypothetical protein [Billgrantia aerodenitrificans]|uniref:Uncharacterized protein n=1 Tax=Billgrantia aerodenitrificans TaxID=2733483 RepID=A0ABS9AUB7_9GAMM|nr:hypothetical protein [Halomonas aerodenitrificans]MCE8025490.1 hypothetical protein [Halomonas aerodenitrificans]